MKMKHMMKEVIDNMLFGVNLADVRVDERTTTCTLHFLFRNQLKYKLNDPEHIEYVTRAEIPLQAVVSAW